MKPWDEFIFSLMHICVRVDVILLYCSLLGRIISVVVDLGDVFLSLLTKTLLLIEITNFLFKCRMFMYYQGMRSISYSNKSW